MDLVSIVAIVYWVVAFWAVPKTIWANKVFISKWGEGYVIVVERALFALFFGWVLIPWALIKKYLSK